MVVLQQRVDFLAQLRLSCTKSIQIDRPLFGGKLERCLEGFFNLFPLLRIHLNTCPDRSMFWSFGSAAWRCRGNHISTVDGILMRKRTKNKGPDSNVKNRRNQPKLVAANFFLAANSANEG